MKIRNYLTIFFAIIAIIALMLLAGYFTYVNTDDSNPFKQSATYFIDDISFDLGIDLEDFLHPSPAKNSR